MSTSVTVPDPARDVGEASALHDSEERFRLLVDGIAEYAIYMLDRDGNVASWNKGAERLKGYRADEILGRHVSVFFIEEDIATDRPRLELARAATDGQVELEGWRVRKDGTRLWTNVVLSALRDDAGRLRGFAKVTRDMTERRDAEQKLRQVEERFRLLVDGVSDHAIYMLDREGRVASWNKGAERMKGYVAEEIIGRDVSVFFVEQEVAAGRPTAELARAAADGRVELEAWRVRKDGSRFWANIVISALRDEQGALRGFAKVTRDESARKELADARLRAAAAKLEQLNRALESSNRELESFAAVASHDLQEPLRKIRAFGDLLKTRFGDALEPEAKDYLERMRGAAGRMQDLIENILTYSRVTSKPRPFASVDLGQVVREVGADLEGPLQQAGGRLEIGTLPVVDADPMQMRQLFQNLVSNALKFRAPDVGPVVKVHGRAVPSSVAGAATVCEIIVDDNGIGFEQKYAERIFGIFQRLHGRGVYEGTGIGLAICRRIVERHEGTIIARGVVGEGAMFVITLPQRQAHAGGENR